MKVRRSGRRLPLGVTVGVEDHRQHSAGVVPGLSPLRLGHGGQFAECERTRVHAPVGLWIGARTADEIALSILAEIVQAIRLDGLQPSAPTAEPQAVAFGRAAAPAHELVTAIDPICGMTVVVADTTPTATVDGDQFWFCCTGCRDRHVAAAH